MAPLGSNVKPSTVTPLDSVRVLLASSGRSSDEPDDATAYTMPVSSSNATSTTALAGSQRRPPLAGFRVGIRVGFAGAGGGGAAGTRGMSVVLAADIVGTAEAVKPSRDRSRSAWSGDSVARSARACATVHGRWYVA